MGNSQKKKIAFIGLGAMGKPMAKNLLKAGYLLTVYDLNTDSVDALKAAGAHPANSSAQAAEKADVVITILPECENVRQAMMGKKGIFEGARPQTVLIDMSSIAPHTSREVAAAAEKRGLLFMDAPVSGGTGGAEKGTLTIMIGGDKDLVEAHMDIFNVLGSTIYHVGGIGMGETVKMINQILVGVNILGIAEAFVLGTKLGADPEVLFNVIRKSAGSSFLLEKRMPDYILKGDFTQPGFALDLLLKDVGLAIESGKLNRIPLFVAAQAFQSLSMASATGLGKKDMSSVIEMYEKAAGVEVRQAAKQSG